MTRSDQNKIIILEAHQARRDYLRSLLSGWGHIPLSFEKDTICLDNLQPLNPRFVISGPLPLEKTFRFITTLKMINAGLPVIMISDDRAVKDFLTINGLPYVRVIRETFEPSEIKDVINRLQADKKGHKTPRGNPIIIGCHPDIIKIKRMIQELSRSNETILIQGEPGTGKALLAKAVHCLSDRRNNPFITMKTTGLTPERFEKEVFGYSTGYFNSLSMTKKGNFELAKTGTIFLDEIDKTSAAVQANLLHILDEDVASTFDPEINEKPDVRIIASSNVALDQLVERGEFRKDLYFRLNRFEMVVPPLRHRIEDISPLVDYFADRFCLEFGKSFYNFSHQTKNTFNRYHWPGNVRELKNMVKNAVLTEKEDSMMSNLIKANQKYISFDTPDWRKNIYTIAELADVKNYMSDLKTLSLKDICKEFITRTEKKFIRKALESTNWNRKKAAIVLNISYKSLLNKIKTYGIA